MAARSRSTRTTPRRLRLTGPRLRLPPDDPAGAVRAWRWLQLRRSSDMTIQSQELIIFLLVGMVAGWLAGILIKGGGFGLLGDMVFGVVGAFVGGWLFAQLGITAWGVVGLLITSLVGAVVVIGLIRLVKHA